MCSPARFQSPKSSDSKGQLLRTAIKRKSTGFSCADANLDGTDIVLSEVAIGTLKPGETKTRQLNMHLSQGSSAAGKFVIAFTDADNAIAETNEESNIVPFGPLE